MKMKLALLSFLAISQVCLGQTKSKSPRQSVEDSRSRLQYTGFVKPLIGTKRMGHTFPGATTPFGMVQLSPETNYLQMFLNKKYNPEAYEYCSGYQYDDSVIFGFSHTHFSGTGHSDLGDFLIMPTTGSLELDPGHADAAGSGFHSSFSHTTEIAQPAFYSVLLEDYKIKAELTASDRVGFHQYTFPKNDSAHILLDLMYNIYNYDDKNVWTFVRVENDSTVTGYRQTSGWGRTRTVYFAMRFSKPFDSYGHHKYDSSLYKGFYRRFNQEQNFPEMAGRNIRAYFNFKTGENEQIKVKFALSSVSTEGAMRNMNAEIPLWSFEQTKMESQAKWNNELAKVMVQTASLKETETFYTALYHTMLSPVLYEDVDGSYRGLDQNIHKSDGFTNYTVFSLWDTYRALHPLFNLIQPSRNNDMVKSMLAHHDQSVHHMLPIWSHYANENWCMIGYHSVSVIADAVAKGTTDVDLNRALKACVNTSTVSYFDGLGDYMKSGYVPEDKSGNSVSKTLEFAYDDWCIAQIAKKANNQTAYKNYRARSLNYKNVYDPAIGYMRPRLANGTWREKFDPMDTEGQGFIEGNALNYGLYVPQEIDTMIRMMGGKTQFADHLDKIFTTQLDDKFIEKNEDITRDGLIGAYVHGNEPGHHIAYLYNWTDKPWKTQERVRMILQTMYSNTPDGLCGNDDAGQMSAWYIFSALGFYPVLPGSDQYAIGSPMVKSAWLRFENGKTLTISTVNQGEKNVYVQKVLVNGKELNRNYLLHSELVNGGEITYILSDKPVK
jgi:predicted alpha-1,2-mannosidase